MIYWILGGLGMLGLAKERPSAARGHVPVALPPAQAPPGKILGTSSGGRPFTTGAPASHMGGVIRDKNGNITAMLEGIGTSEGGRHPFDPRPLPPAQQAPTDRFGIGGGAIHYQPPTMGPVYRPPVVGTGWSLAGTGGPPGTGAALIARHGGLTPRAGSTTVVPLVGG